ncbi:hypothetical protein CVS42_10985 [Aeromonas veronii]|uniref:ImmA/IrrE family metallo-endopeptidase n=1 Tax=Aeromonas veronii TaxID=654 RepID=UPI000C2890BB|nr:ImmA/IrrE family metallo-endopeptidase [Aeromonas veronii]ATY81303.1 hypothetical protein CVS42_10985 [Aeromonas veronii]
MTLATEKNDVISLTDALKINSPADLLHHLFGDISSMELPVPIEKIITRIEKTSIQSGFDVNDLFSSGYIRVIRKDDDSVDMIHLWANPTEAPSRQRFTLAHELGHLFYDVLPNISSKNTNDFIVDDNLKRGGIKSYKETKADRFAAQLLMPPQLIRREIDILVTTLKSEGKKMPIESIIKLLSNKFYVSEKAMKIRLETLGYIKKQDS